MESRFRNLFRWAGIGGVAALILGVALVKVPAPSAATVYGTRIPAPQVRLQQVGHRNSAQAVLAGGCFWGMELVFSHVKGVTDVVAGYAGGDKAHANYHDSSSGRYGDAESVRVTFDPGQISYGDLLQIYFSVAHDPTEVNRQGPDTGSQYRSEIFAANKEQAQVARDYIQQLDAARVFRKPIATRVSVGQSFFPAKLPPDYGRLHPNAPYIQVNDMPKLRALKQRFPHRYTAHYAEGAPSWQAGR